LCLRCYDQVGIDFYSFYIHNSLSFIGAPVYDKSLTQFVGILSNQVIVEQNNIDNNRAIYTLDLSLIPKDEIIRELESNTPSMEFIDDATIKINNISYQYYLREKVGDKKQGCLNRYSFLLIPSQNFYYVGIDLKSKEIFRLLNLVSDQDLLSFSKKISIISQVDHIRRPDEELTANLIQKENNILLFNTEDVPIPCNILSSMKKASFGIRMKRIGPSIAGQSDFWKQQHAYLDGLDKDEVFIARLLKKTKTGLKIGSTPIYSTNQYFKRLFNGYEPEKE